MLTKRKKEWFDDDSFWRTSYPVIFPKAAFDNATPEVKKIIKLTRPKGKAVLDLCCGPGRHSVALAKLGYKVTGVDRTKFYLAKARALAREAHAIVEWIQMDMRDFVRPESFDLIINLYTSFGYFDDKEQDMVVLKNILASLKPGGILVMDLVGKERLAKIFVSAAVEDLPDGSILVRRHEAIDNWSRMSNEWIIVKNGKARSIRFHHTIYSGQEIKDRLEMAGFADVHIYGSFDGDSYGPGSPRLVAVAKKPK